MREKIKCIYNYLIKLYYFRNHSKQRIVQYNNHYSFWIKNVLLWQIKNNKNKNIRFQHIIELKINLTLLLFNLIRRLDYKIISFKDYLRITLNNIIFSVSSFGEKVFTKRQLTNVKRFHCFKTKKEKFRKS